MTYLHPTQWDVTTPPTPGRLVEAGVSFVVNCSADTGWRYAVVLQHDPTGVSVTTGAGEREPAMLAAWAALQTAVMEHERMIEQ